MIMFCSKCGKMNNDNVQYCQFCGSVMVQGQPCAPGMTGQFGNQVPPVYTANNYGGYPINANNYLVFSILVTILCCLPCGIAAIIYSNNINTCLAMGDHAGAQAAANSAKTWNIIGAIGGGLVTLFYIVVMIAGAAM